MTTTVGNLPCGVCGQAVESPDPSTIRDVQAVRNGVAARTQVATCRQCAERDQNADDLARLDLGGGVIVGQRRYNGDDTADLLRDARAALDAAGVRPPGLGDDRRAALASEVVHLAGLIRGMRWAERLSPPSSVLYATTPVEPGVPNAEPWEHLDEADRDALRTAVAKLLAERVAALAPPVALTPPMSAARGQELAGCLYCGVGTVTMTAVAVKRAGGAGAAARSVWTSRRVSPATLGALASPEVLRGWLCPACEGAAASVGSANSASALEEALSTFLGVSRRTFLGEEQWVDGLQGWGALVADARRRGRPDPAPHETPWAHLRQDERDRLANLWRGSVPSGQ